MIAANFRYNHSRGPIYGYITEKGLRELLLPYSGRKQERIPLQYSASNITLNLTLRRMLEAYFAGVQEEFAAFPLDLSGATAFQREVWEEARRIPWGKTLSYGDLAKRLGRSTAAARAVGQALGANPIPILIPCHRVLPSAGGLGGFSAGLPWKQALLELEGVIPRKR